MTGGPAPTSPLLVLTGTPGAGKTTVAARFAAATPRGIHLSGDAFFDFLAHPIPPVKPESHAQNGVVMRAFARAAGAWAEGGYEVVLDGIVGPWFLPVVARELLPLGVVVDYAVLRVELAAACDRACGRAEKPAPEEVVRAMHRAFADLGDFEAHAIEVGGADPDAVAERVRRLRSAGALRLDLARLASSAP